MRLVLAAAILSLTAGSAFAADSAQAVLDHHVAQMKAGSLDGVMADYADNAVVIAPHGIAPGQTNVSGNDVFAGKANIRKFFAVLTDNDAEKLRSVGIGGDALSLSDAEIEQLIAERQAARKGRDFATADRIRQQLADRGIVLEDSREGVIRWKRK